MLAAGKTSGVFQLESSGMTGVCVSLKPQNIEDITALIALYRPGPMDSIPKFIACKHDPSKVTYLIPQLEPILSITYGCIVYQEQVIQIFQQLAGYTLGRGGYAPPRHEQEKRSRTLKRSAARSCTATRAGASRAASPSGISEAPRRRSDDIYAFANYAFNKGARRGLRGHRVPDGVFQGAISRRNIWRRCSRAYWTAARRSRGYIGEGCREVRHRAPCRRTSTGRMTALRSSRRASRFGLVAIKNIGRGLIARMMREREVNGPLRIFRISAIAWMAMT